MTARERIGALVTAGILAAAVTACGSPELGDADLVLVGGEVWTGSGNGSGATAVALAGDRILAVGSDESVRRHEGPETRVVQLDGRFVAPGFIDNHTHFNRAGELLLGVNLLDVSDEVALVDSVRAARDRMPEGGWVVGGGWGGYEARETGCIDPPVLVRKNMVTFVEILPRLVQTIGPVDTSKHSSCSVDTSWNSQMMSHRLQLRQLMRFFPSKNRRFKPQQTMQW
jgi:hypothetical protein